MAEYADITGRRSGLLTAKQFHHKGKTGAQFWLCECACGNTRIVANVPLLTGNVRSCADCENRLGRLPNKHILTREWERLGGKSILARKRKRAREWREARKKTSSREESRWQSHRERHAPDRPVIIAPPIPTEAEAQRANERENERMKAREAAYRREVEKIRAAIRDGKPLPVPQLKVK